MHVEPEPGPLASGAGRFAGVFVLSFVVKLVGAVAVALTDAQLVTVDAMQAYLPVAANMREGLGYVLKGDPAEATLVAPLFPLWLAALQAVTGAVAPLKTIWVLNALLRAVTTVLAGIIGTRLFGPRAGMLAALLHALDPWEAFWTAFVVKEALTVLLCTGATAAAMAALERPDRERALLAGVLLGLAALGRYASLGLLPWLLAVVVWRAGRRRITPKHAAVVAAGLIVVPALLLGPLVLRNRIVTGSAVLSIHGAGRYLFTSNASTGERRGGDAGHPGVVLPPRGQVAGVERSRKLPADRDALFAQRTLEHLLANPAAIPALVHERAVSFWRPTFAGSSRRNLLVLGLPYVVTLALAAVGIVMARGPQARLLLWTCGFYVCLHLVFMAGIRHRQYLSPLLAAFAGHTLARLLPARFLEATRVG